MKTCLETVNREKPTGVGGEDLNYFLLARKVTCNSGVVQITNIYYMPNTEV